MVVFLGEDEVGQTGADTEAFEELCGVERCVSVSASMRMSECDTYGGR